MAEFQRTNGVKVGSPITVTVCKAVHLKVIPGSKEPLPTATATPEKIARVINAHARITANFTTFQLEGVLPGKAILQATGGTPGKVLAGPIDIIIENCVELPSAQTDAGLFARLFLAEAPNPEDPHYTIPEDVKVSMSWMRVVVENRLAKPRVEWASAGAKTLADVVRAEGQFAGFSKYPYLPNNIQRNIDDAIRIANDGEDSRRSAYKAHVDAALTVAAMPKVIDPSQNGLYWWRTSESGKPSAAVKMFMTKAGNTFFTRSN